jgi:hypothetical protein
LKTQSSNSASWERAGGGVCLAIILMAIAVLCGWHACLLEVNTNMIFEDSVLELRVNRVPDPGDYFQNIVKTVREPLLLLKLQRYEPPKLER